MHVLPVLPELRSNLKWYFMLHHKDWDAGWYFRVLLVSFALSVKVFNWCFVLHFKDWDVGWFLYLLPVSCELSSKVNWRFLLRLNVRPEIIVMVDWILRTWMLCDITACFYHRLHWSKGLDRYFSTTVLYLRCSPILVLGRWGGGGGVPCIVSCITIKTGA